MTIRHLAYLACDGCLNICDDSDRHNAAEVRRTAFPRDWSRVLVTEEVVETFDSNIPSWWAGAKRVDLCPACLTKLATGEQP